MQSEIDLSRLTNSAAIEIDMYLLGRDNNDFSSVKELAKTIDDYIPKEPYGINSMLDFPFGVFLASMKSESKGEMSYLSELALEIIIC